jgi:hypothetical protein
MAIETADDETVISGIPGEVEDETTEDEAKPSGVATEDEAEEDDEVTVSIGEDPPSSEEDEATAPTWVKDLRKQQKELTKRNRELEDQLKQLAPQAKPVELGAKPTLETCEYDAERFETELTAYHDRKRQVENEAANREREVENSKKAWQGTLTEYKDKSEKLKVKDFSDAEDFVKDTLSVTQQGIILQGAKDAALVVYALGKNKAKASALAKIADPIKFAFEVARLEKDLKVSTKKAPPPERVIRNGGTPLSGGNSDRTLERLRAEADKTGNYSKVVAYKNQLKSKG